MYEIRIEGDTNDGDYETNVTTIGSLTEVVFMEDQLFEGSPQLRYYEFLTKLSEALSKTVKENPKSWDSHNWCRDEFDERKDYAHRTTINFMESIGFDYDNAPDEDETDELIASVHDELQRYIHAGEYGVHTVQSIKVVPIGEEIVYL